MSSVNAEFIERCQLEYEKNPKSRVFAPLAEAYRKMGLHEEAKSICQRGVQNHPDFAGGHVAYAKILLDLKSYPEALTHLKKATQLSPDNILAQTLLGETLLELRRPKEALKAFKMILFLSPHDEKAQAAVKKWEFLTADEYDDEIFAMRPLFKSPGSANAPEDNSRPKTSTDPHTEATAQLLNKVISIADAFTIRNDVEGAVHTLREGIRTLGQRPELQTRLQLLLRRSTAQSSSETTNIDDQSRAQPVSSDSVRTQKRLILEQMLQRISERRLRG